MSAIPSLTHPQDDRSRQAIAYHWASRVISISVEMILPGIAGYWLDQKLGTVALFTVLGFSFGLTIGIVHLLQIAQPRKTKDSRGSTEESSKR